MRYEWTWQWEANRISLTDIAPSVLLAELEVKIRNQLAMRPEVVKVESVTFSNVKHWTEALFSRRYSGTAITVFESTIESKSPIDPAIIALITWVVIAVIAAIVAFVVWTVFSGVKEIVAPAGGLGSLALLAVIGLGIYAYMKTRK